MRAISVLAAYKVASRSLTFHVAMFTVLWFFTTPECSSSETCTWFLEDAIRKLKWMHLILACSQAIIILFDRLKSKNERNHENAARFALSKYAEAFYYNMFPEEKPENFGPPAKKPEDEHAPLDELLGGHKHMAPLFNQKCDGFMKTTAMMLSIFNVLVYTSFLMVAGSVWVDCGDKTSSVRDGSSS